MNIAILPVGQVDGAVVSSIRENLGTAMFDAETSLITKPLPLPEEAYAKSRCQYRSDIILKTIHGFAETHHSLDRVLGIADIDLFVTRLNFVFGQAEYQGKAALISIWRLRPEFYEKSRDDHLLVERSTKEALHELGHTLGLKHCTNPFCVMYFSNAIFETDRKQSLFCNKCYLKATITADKGSTLERRV